MLLCVITLFLLCGTTTGLMLDIQFLSRVLPGNIHVEHTSGTLFSSFSLHDISYQYEGQSVTIKSLDVRWYPSQLLKGKIAFDTVSISDAFIKLHAQKSDSHTNVESTHSLPQFLYSITFNQLHFNNILFQQDNQWLTLQGKIDQNWDIKWAFNLPNINAFSIPMQGALAGSGTVSGARSLPRIQISMNGKKLEYREQHIANITVLADIKPTQPSSLRIKASGLTIADYSFEQFDLTAKGLVKKVKKKLLTTIQLNVGNHFNLNMNLISPSFSELHPLKQAIAGDLTFSGNDLSILNILIPDIKNAHGILNGKVSIQGTLSHPIITSDFKLTEGSFFLPVLGIQPDHITAQGQINDTFNLVFNGTLRSGNGTGGFQGSCDLTQPTYPLTITFLGNQLEIIRLPEYKINASPDLKLILNYPSLQLQGKVSIPYAKVTPKNINDALSLPDEVIFVNEEKSTTTPSSIFLTLQINLHLGENVNIDYDNLKATLSGDISIEKMPDSPPKASGELYTTQGKYSAYGQKLTIETGRLIYTGNTLTNPGLNIRAVKNVRRIVTQNASGFMGNTSLQAIPIDTETVAVGVQVAGTADNPKISLFSIPSDLSQADILSYLILGVPQSQASGAQRSILFTALSAYQSDTNNILDLPNKLQQTFGLNELNVESVQTFNPTTQTVQPTTSFVVGKQITQKISVHYSIGLFNPISILNVRYRINPHWAIQSETSTIDSGADLLYEFERN